MTTTEEVPMPEPDAYRITWSPHPFSAPELTASRARIEDIRLLELQPVIDDMFIADQLRAYADARCAKLRAECDALAEKVKAIDQCSDTTQSLIRMLIVRDQLGRQKYGATLDRTDLTHEQWLQHLAEELLDGAGYALAAIRAAGDGGVPA